MSLAASHAQRFCCQLCRPLCVLYVSFLGLPAVIRALMVCVTCISVCCWLHCVILPEALHYGVSIRWVA